MGLFSTLTSRSGVRREACGGDLQDHDHADDGSYDNPYHQRDGASDHERVTHSAPHEAGLLTGGPEQALDLLAELGVELSQPREEFILLIDSHARHFAAVDIRESVGDPLDLTEGAVVRGVGHPSSPLPSRIVKGWR